MKLLKQISLSVLAFFLLSLAPVYAYTDLGLSDDYSEAIESLSGDGVIEGYPDDTFRSNLPINRAEYTKILIHAKLGYEPVDYATDCFPDVPEDEWFASYVCYAEENGIIEGYPSGDFEPGTDINYAEAAKIIVNTFVVGQVDSLGDEWFHPFVESMATNNYVPPSIFRNDRLVTRGEMAEMIYRVQGNIQTEDSIPIELFQPLEKCTDSTFDPGVETWLFHYPALYGWSSIQKQGVHCQLDNGREIYSILVVNNDYESERWLVYFEEETGFIRHLALDCLVAGDMPVATLEMSPEGQIFAFCSGADAGWFGEEVFEITVDDQILLSHLIGDGHYGGESYTPINVPEETSNNSSLDDALYSYASDLGLDATQFEVCYQELRYNESIQADFDAGVSLSVSGVPSFFINGEKFVGALPYSVFEENIEAALLTDFESRAGIYSTDDAPFLGDLNAPVVMVQFSEFQDPFSKRFLDETFGQIQENYIDTGQVLFIFRDFPLVYHKNANLTANAAQCADEQNEFWNYHKLLFETQEYWDDLN